MQALNFTLIAVLSAGFAAVANILARTLLRDIKSQSILGINFLTMAATMVLISPLFYKFIFSAKAAALVVLIASIDLLANYFYFKTFEKTPASVATPLLSLAPAFTFLFGWVFLKDIASLLTYVLAGAIIALVIIFSTDFKGFKEFRASTLKPAILASLFFGISAVPAKYLLQTLGALNVPTLYMLRAGLIALFALIIFGFPITGISTKQYRMIFLRGLFVICQWLLLYFALTSGNAGVTVTLANITPIFVFVLAAIFLHEKLTMRKVITGCLILVLSIFI